LIEQAMGYYHYFLIRKNTITPLKALY